MARTLFVFALIIAAASAFVQPANMAGKSVILISFTTYRAQGCIVSTLLEADDVTPSYQENKHHLIA